VVTPLIMKLLFCKAAPFAPRDPATDALKVNADAIAAQESARLEQEAEAERLRAQEQQRMLEEAAERARLEEENRRLREEEEREQTRLAEEARLLEEERLRQEHEEEARRIEAERLRAEQAKKERQDAINAFCARYGFNFNDWKNEPRRAGCTVLGSTSTYALLQAAELGDAKIVEMMLEEGASPLQQNSSKKTAAELAQKKNKSGSHDAVLQVLRNSTAGGA